MNIDKVLEQVRDGYLTIDQAKEQLATYEDLGYAKIDHHRKKRQGFPEVIYGEGKSVEQIVAILEAIKSQGDSILATRIAKEKADAILIKHPELIYHPVAEIIYWTGKPITHDQNKTYVAVICAGTSDLRVAEEAAITAEVLGCRVKRFYDVGVAGIHRLLDKAQAIQNASVSIVVAGMEGALPSVVGGLVAHPILAVPTSVGYGANFHGLSALLTMLNSCASGISVVNIDNGFGAAYSAVLIDQLARKASQHDETNERM